MILLIRIGLICLIGYLIARSFAKYGEDGAKSSEPESRIKKEETPSKKISKKVGEYVDYEEIKDQTP